MDFRSIADAFSNFLGNYGMPLGMGAQGIGTLLRSQANKRIARAQADKVQQERARQRAIQQDIDARTQAAIAQATPAAQEAERMSIASKYLAQMQPATGVAAVDEFVPGNPGAPVEVRDRAEGVLADARKKAAQYTSSLSNLKSYGGLNQSRGFAMGDATRDVNALLDKSSGSAGLLPLELESAKRAGRSLATASDIANGIGGVSFLFGAMNQKPPQKPSSSGMKGRG
jgi:hypothetical protein